MAEDAKPLEDMAKDTATKVGDATKRLTEDVMVDGRQVASKMAKSAEGILQAGEDRLHKAQSKIAREGGRDQQEVDKTPSR
jgi:hypothetical protein